MAMGDADMTNPARTFAVASDEALVELISRARYRLVVIAPALTKPVGLKTDQGEVAFEFDGRMFKIRKFNTDRANGHVA
jgi:hypothetical protein